MRKIDKIIIHCAFTKPSMDIGAKEIREWHVNGNKWSDIGYHYVIRRNGAVEKGRKESVAGAHCVGHNSNSIGVCLVGGMDGQGRAANNFTEQQFETLQNLVAELLAAYPSATVHGHNEFSNKDCPCFNVKDWVRQCRFY